MARQRKADQAEPDDGRVDEKAPDAPVYDERGNVRPRGTEGAKPMSFEERAALARKQDRGGDVPPDGEPAVREAEAQRAEASSQTDKKS